MPRPPPPTTSEGRVAVGGYAYCFGGGGCEPDGPASDCYSPSYFAPLTPNGFGPWNPTTQLPTAVSATFASSGSTLYYLSDHVFYANVTSNGIGPWQTTTNYPNSLYPTNCISSGGYLYCAGAGTGASYFAPIGIPDPQAIVPSPPLPFPRAQYHHAGGGHDHRDRGRSRRRPPALTRLSARWLTWVGAFARKGTKASTN